MNGKEITVAIEEPGNDQTTHNNHSDAFRHRDGDHPTNGCAAIIVLLVGFTLGLIVGLML